MGEGWVSEQSCGRKWRGSIARVWIVEHTNQGLVVDGSRYVLLDLGSKKPDMSCILLEEEAATEAKFGP